jgi:Stage II sporulation protein E (SpoIIE)
MTQTITAPAAESEPTTTGPVRRHLVPVIVLVVGLAVTAILTVVCWTVNDHNETRLLDLQVGEAGTVVSAAVPDIENPLSLAADIAVATDGNPASFTSLAKAYVGPLGRYQSVALWRITGGTPHLVAVVGSQPGLAESAGLASSLDAAEVTHLFQVHPSLSGTEPHIVFSQSSAVSSPFVVDAVSVVHPHQPLDVARNTAFDDLNYALYLGTTPNPHMLLGATDVSVLPLRGRVASVVTPLGNVRLLLVASPVGELGGSLVNNLAWIVAILGVLFTIIAALSAEVLVRGRRLAEQLAVQNHLLYGQQRDIAQTLQHALLPGHLPATTGVELAVRYLPGAEGVDIGGDWYDVIASEDGDSCLFAVGDVSGRGIEAATTMASLRYAIRAYAAEGDSPATILNKLSGLLDVETDRQFATVLCGVVHPDRHALVASAGHLSPLIVANGTSHYLDSRPGVPVGVPQDQPYENVELSFAPGTILLAFTDGLVERRGENIDVGLERLRVAANGGAGSVDALLTRVLDSVLPDDSKDDTAILGMRWR